MGLTSECDPREEFGSTSLRDPKLAHHHLSRWLRRGGAVGVQGSPSVGCRSPVQLWAQGDLGIRLQLALAASLARSPRLATGTGHHLWPQKAPGHVLAASGLGPCSIQEVPGPCLGSHRARVPQPLVFARCPHRPQGRKSWHCQRVMSPRKDPVILSIPSRLARDLEPLKPSAPALCHLWSLLSCANMPAAYSPVTNPMKNKE